MTSLTELLTLADELLAYEELNDQFLESLNSFTVGMQGLMDSLGDSVADKTEEEVAKLTDLASKHALIVEKSQNARDGMFSDMKELEKRGNAIRRYVDTLPKRISRMGVKKG